MPASDPIVADPSPLLNLAQIGRLHLHSEQFECLTATHIFWTDYPCVSPDHHQTW